MFKIIVQCHKCGRDREIGKESNRGWYDPYYIWLPKEGHWLQTQLCQNCAPKLSLGYYLQWHRRPRWLHRLYAAVMGYFWLPCPRCGRYFGGHEMGGGRIDHGGYGEGTCPLCPETTHEPEKEII